MQLRSVWLQTFIRCLWWRGGWEGGKPEDIGVYVEEVKNRDKVTLFEWRMEREGKVGVWRRGG